MKQWFMSTLFVAVAVSVCLGQGPSPAILPGPAPTQSSAAQTTAAANQVHGLFTVELAKSLDSKKLKPGDEVDGKLLMDLHAADGVTIHRGSKVIGHVIEAKARSKGDSESALAIGFDKIVRPGGEDTPINSVIQAVAPNPNAEVNTGGGIGYGDMKQATAAPPSPDASRGPVPLLTEDSTGVLGIKNLQLGPDGVLTSSGKEVKLESGTRILLKASMQ
jgi:hypothetical protein